ncbi:MULTISPECIES: DUF502 domain-containing protein [Cytobacillus]|jgi:uncharacterized membrane protein|uniref:DUF502 domain-containing protein n=2 Tax=Cytobacillus TaxID=2675230 RepID=A0ABX3CTA9_9BACI|nr:MULTISPECIES: DUF502 domain-containing protein [Cytobacillus]EFV77838.1 hypothetical protein HMPREF1013_01945 [Bacillus sp. 2_A_57_CT2]MBY0154900.1 DUF502 domain-containing protein [Cytobacillus firmus]MBU8731577.1 DUF502 domain-containing protein [Cytobacillus oceanisediminis]MBU8771219.1 DUF502 domain-containing protein [Cytobacillus oceanisediminis]MCM3243455.1 DUF502 domain-containing protein [Cytobacillus oceanisediminis]
MKSLLKNFINGILTIVPIILAIFVVVKTFLFLDSILGNLLKPYLKDDYIPGIGLIATLILITLLGWLSTNFLTGSIIKLVDRMLERIPLVKTIYTVIKDTVHSFLGEKKSFSKVALVTIPGTEMKSLGFITSEELEEFYDPLKEYAAVYVPQTFQVAGFTFLIPKDQIEIIDVKPENAMKFILSGGMTSKGVPEKDRSF